MALYILSGSYLIKQYITLHCYATLYDQLSENPTCMHFLGFYFMTFLLSRGYYKAMWALINNVPELILHLSELTAMLCTESTNKIMIYCN